MEFTILNEAGTVTAVRYLEAFTSDVPREFTYTRVVVVEGYRLLWGTFKGEENDPILMESETSLSSARPSKKGYLLKSWIDALADKLSALNTTLTRVMNNSRVMLIKRQTGNKAEEGNEVIKSDYETIDNNIELWVILSFL